MSEYGIFSGPYFPAFGLNTKRYSVSLRIQSECGNIRTRKNSVFGHSSCSVSFNEYFNQKINKCSKVIGLMKRLSLKLSRKQLLTIYKTFVRSHLDYADIIYDKPFNNSIKKKLQHV